MVPSIWTRGSLLCKADWEEGQAFRALVFPIDVRRNHYIHQKVSTSTTGCTKEGYAGGRDGYAGGRDCARLCRNTRKPQPLLDLRHNAATLAAVVCAGVCAGFLNSRILWPELKTVKVFGPLLRQNPILRVSGIHKFISTLLFIVLPFIWYFRIHSSDKQGNGETRRLGARPRATPSTRLCNYSSPATLGCSRRWRQGEPAQRLEALTVVERSEIASRPT